MDQQVKQRGFSLIIYAVLALAILGTLAGISYKIRESGKDAIRVEWAAANAAAREEEAKQAAAAATKTEVARVEIRYRTKTITKEVDKIVDRPIYSSVCLDTDGLRLARCAILGKSADSCKLDKPLPGAGAVGERHGGIRLAMDSGSFGALSRMQ
jgi:hypothetical protein